MTRNHYSKVDDEVEASAGLLRHPSAATTRDRDDPCENFLYVFERRATKSGSAFDLLKIPPEDKQEYSFQRCMSMLQTVLMAGR